MTKTCMDCKRKFRCEVLVNVNAGLKKRVFALTKEKSVLVLRALAENCGGFEEGLTWK